MSTHTYLTLDTQRYTDCVALEESRVSISQWDSRFVPRRSRGKNSILSARDTIRLEKINADILIVSCSRLVRTVARHLRVATGDETRALRLVEIYRREARKKKEEVVLNQRLGVLRR